MGDSNRSLELLNADERTDETREPKRDIYLAQIEVSILSVMFTATLLGNGLALTALGARRQRRLTRMHYFILHLCISDLTVAFFNILPQLIMDITGRFIGGYPGDNVLCKFVKFMQLFAPLLSSYVLVVTAIDRYQAICFPMRNCSWTPRRSKILIGCAWAVSGLCSVPQLFVFSYKQAEPYPHYDCWTTFVKPWGERSYVMWNTIAIFFIPLFILIFTYTCVCRAIWVNFRQTSSCSTPVINSDIKKVKPVNGHILNNLAENNRDLRKLSYIDDDDESSTILSNRPKTKTNTATNTNDCLLPPSKTEATSPRVRTPVHPIRSHTSVNRISRAKMKTVKLTIAVIFCYIVCSLPFFSSIIYAKWINVDKNNTFLTSYAFTLLALLVSLNSCVNPWLYLVFNENLARTAKELLQCRLHRSPRFPCSTPGVPLSHSSLSETRLATVLTVARISGHNTHQMELKPLNNADGDGSKVTNGTDKNSYDTKSDTNRTAVKKKNENNSLKIKNCNKITCPGHKCDDSSPVNNCEQL
ncbi:hypothetical protein CHUAL_003403 [Chamberlinius hualienensis]